MLLRRITEHLRTQNWLAVFLDFLVVVLGIFVGLQVDNWNQWRADRTEEKQLLEALAIDFARNELIPAKVRRNHELVAESEQAIITYGETGIVPEAERTRFETLVSNHGSRWVYEPVMGTVQSLINTNKINLLSDRPLISLLTQWPQVVEALNVEEIDAKTHYQEIIFPFLAERIDFEDHDKGFSACCFNDPASGQQGTYQMEYPWVQEATETYLLACSRPRIFESYLLALGAQHEQVKCVKGCRNYFA